MTQELYPNNVNSNTIWPQNISGQEIDLRQELADMLYGYNGEVPKGQLGILRRMRRDDDNDLVICPCVSNLTGEPDRDTICPYCWGEGYLWDEEWIVYRKVLVSSHEGLVRKNQPYQAGVTNTPFVFFYVEHFVNPTSNDRIVEINLDTEGDPSIPYTREAIYTIATAEDFRSDNGRIEYWRLAGVKRSIKSTWEG